MTDEELKKDRIARAAVWEPRKDELTAEILAHPFSQSKLENYQAFYVRHMAERIADRKISVAVYGPALLERYDNLQMQHVTYGFTLLELVLQKKLFNLQLEWRANRIQIPEIKVSYDFFAYANDIFNCPFLEIISPEELEMLRLYMKSYNFSTHVGWFGVSMEWQHYDMLMQKDGEGDRSAMPEFYEFYDSHLGTFHLLNLPDERGEMERRYLEARMEKRQKEYEQKLKEAENNPELKPKTFFFSFDPEIQKRIFSETEPEDFFEMKDVADEEMRENKESAVYELTEELDEITDAHITLPTYMPWDEGLAKALQDYRLQKSAEVLDLTYEEYLMKAELHLFDTAEIEADLAKSDYRAAIREGRKALGEPENLDF